MASRFLDTLHKNVLLFDGAMGTSIHSCADCKPEDYLGRDNCTDILVKSRPDMIQRIHETFLLAGADVVETDTFGTNKLVGAEFDPELMAWTRELNKLGAQVARAACAKHATKERPRFVAGSMGPGTKLITLGNTSWEAMLDSYTEQARGLIDGGVDCFMIETCQDLLQVKCAINACLDALGESNRTVNDIPILVSVTMETTGTMLLGSDMAAVVNALKPFPIVSLGLNCATGPVEMAEHIAYLAKHWDRAVSVVPNAGLPILVEGRTEYPLRADAFANAMRRFIEEYKIDIVGGCCGTTPEHIHEVRKVLGESRARMKRATTPQTPGCSSLYGMTEFKQDNSFLIVAERTNANGSRKFKRLLDEEQWDALVGMAREETKDGSHLLDVCVDFVGRNGVTDMGEFVSRVVRQVNAPLMLDSTEAPVLEAGLKRSAGRCIVNSINLEDGEGRMNSVCPLLKRYGAACVALTIDEDPQAGMAKTAERKLEIAKRIHDLYTRKWGLDESDLIFDPLTFTIATGNEDDRELGWQTLDGIEQIAKEFPKCGIILGLSNISFGLKPSARTVLNTVFLGEARKRGLTAAIVHFSKLLPKNRIAREQWEAAEWLIFDRRGKTRPEGKPADFDPLLHYISLFPDGEEQVEKKKGMSDLPLEERLQRHIIDGDDGVLAESLTEAMKKYDPLAIINDHLLAGMKTVGDLFGAGSMQLPFVLQSAGVMKKAVAFLQPFMVKQGVAEKPKATVVLATVAGDVHDIGKNLVDIILSNNGFKVHNIGIKQSLQQIVDAWKSTNADTIGMSGLLVKSVTVMERNLQELNELNIRIPIMLGGAALTRHYAEGHLRGIYKGPLYYGKDAFEGLSVCNALAGGTLAEVDSEIAARLTKRAEVDAKVGQRLEAAASSTSTATERSEVKRDVPVPKPPFWGDRLVEEIDLDAIYPFVNKIALYRGQWGFKRGDMDEAQHEAMIRDKAEPIFERLKIQCKAERILRPAVVYGFFPCASEGNDLVVYDPADPEREMERFSFPRQTARQRLCISDFFRPASSGERDVVAFHCVTMGIEVSHRAKQLFERNEYTEYLYLHGMGVECAEALAELWHKRIRAELGIGHEDSPRVKELFTQKYRGSRYSFGYPACPEMSDQEKLFKLLKPERIGCHLSENWQIDPEQSTSAIIVHHPEAKYFAI
ncbi:MAG: methionine synthase [Planctomycetes bacterium]|nr:methionine synthase [Planctomycetota bacterium]